MSHEKPTVGDIWVRRDNGERVLVIGFGDGMNLKLWNWDDVSPDDLRKVCRFAFSAFDIPPTDERTLPEGVHSISWTSGKLHYEVAQHTDNTWGWYVEIELPDGSLMLVSESDKSEHKLTWMDARDAALSATEDVDK